MSGEKTEQPTPQRLRKAREEGQVAKSKDFTQVLLMAALFGWTLMNAGDIFRTMGGLMALPGQLHGQPFALALSVLVGAAARAIMDLLVPYLLLVVVIGVLGEVTQTGFLISFKALMPKGEKLNPVTNAQQMFSSKNLIEFVKTTLKVIVLTAVVYLVVRDSLAPLVKVPAAGMGAAGLVLGEMMQVLVIKVMVVFGAIALFDLVVQRWQHTKSLMMSVDEIKQEYKQMEGDPHMKGHRREMAREIAMGEAVAQTRKSDVVVANPTHLSVALRYEQGVTPLPVVMAKGEGAIALAMRRAAAEEGIPVLRDVPLARALMREAAVGQFIPSGQIEPVAQILLAVRRMQQLRDLEESHE